MEYITEKFKKIFAPRQLNGGRTAYIKVKPMKFDINHYDVKGFGHFVTMKGSAMLGIMKMDTVIFTPTKKDAPLFSCDRIKVFGNDTLILELYDTLLDKDIAALYDGLQDEKEKLKDIADHDLGSRWYDHLKLPATFCKKGKKCSGRFDSSYESFFNRYLDLLYKAPVCSEAEKKAKTLEYVNGLFENGGPSTDAFVNGVGRPAAEKLFKKVIFGVE